MISYFEEIFFHFVQIFLRFSSFGVMTLIKHVITAIICSRRHL